MMLMKQRKAFFRTLYFFIGLAVTVGTVTYGQSKPGTGVSFKHDTEAQTVAVHIRGEHFTTFQYAERWHVPFLWPVHGEGGIGLTRNYPMGTDEPAITDHPHHLSLYLTYGALNGRDFWHIGRRGTGVIRTVAVETGEGDGYGWLRARLNWVTAGDEDLVMEEMREFRFHDSPASARVFDFISTFKATQGDVTFGDTKEGMLGLRMRPEIDGKHGGILTNAQGQQGERNVYGKPSPWLDFTGEVEGHGKRGIAIFDHPGNFRPAQWHARDYGLVGVNPFGTSAIGGGRNGRHKIQEGDALTLHYRFFIHSGSHEDADVAAQYSRFIE